MKKIDIHAHYGKWPFMGRDSSVEDILASMGKFDIGAFFLSASKALMYDFVEGNAGLFEKIEGCSGLYGYVVVNSNYPDKSFQEICKYQNHPQFIGVKYHPEYCRKPADCRELEKIYEWLEAKGIPVLIHSFGEGISSPMRLIPLNRKFPALKVVAAHMGGPRYDLGLELVQNSNENIFLEICSTDISSGKIEKAVKVAGVGRVLFGTDYTLFHPSHVIGALESSKLDEVEKEHIYRLNAEKIFQVKI